MPRAINNRRATTLPDDLKEHYEDMFGEKFPLSLNEAMDYVKYELGLRQFYPSVIAHSGKVRVEHHWQREIPEGVRLQDYIRRMQQLQNYQRNTMTKTSVTGTASVAASLSGSGIAANTFSHAPRYEPMYDYWSTSKFSTKDLDKFVAKILKQVGDNR